MDEKLERIIAESLQLFNKHGIRNISMDDIARQLGISKKTLYLHVANKTELIERVLQHYGSEGTAPCFNKPIDQLNAIDILLAVSRSVIRQIQTINPLNMFELKKYYPSLFNDFVKNKREHVQNQIIQNIRQGQQENLYRTDLDAELIAHMYFQQMIGINEPEINEIGNFTTEHIFKVMFDSHIRSIANAEGLAYYEKQIKLASF